MSVPTQQEYKVLRDENRRLRALVDFTRQVTAERDVRAQLRLLCSELGRATECAAAAVVLRDAELGSIESIETCGMSLRVDAEWQQAVRAEPGGADRHALPGEGAERLDVHVAQLRHPG